MEKVYSAIARRGDFSRRGVIPLDKFPEPVEDTTAELSHRGIARGIGGAEGHLVGSPGFKPVVPVTSW